MVIMMAFLMSCAASVSFAQAVTVSTLAERLPGSIEGLAIDQNGNLYTPSAQVLSAVFTISPEGVHQVFANGFNWPQGGGFDAAGNYYVSNWGGNSISKVTSDGSSWVFATGIPGPTGITPGPGGEFLYVSSWSGDSVYKVSLNDSSATRFVIGHGISGPDGLVFDEEGNLYVANSKDTAILKVAPDGSFQLFAPALPGSSTGYLTRIDDHLYVAGLMTNQIFKVSLAGEVTVLAGNGEAGHIDGPADQAQFDAPNGIVADPDGTKLYVADAGNRSIRVIHLDTTVGSDEQPEVGDGFWLAPSYPNPASSSVTIAIDLPVAVPVKLSIYDVTGRQVKVFSIGMKAPGIHPVYWNGTADDGSSLASGVYLYRLVAGDHIETKELILTR